MGRYRNPVSFNLEEGEQEKLTQVAKGLGFIWGERGNPSALLSAIANGEVMIQVPEAYDGELATLRQQLKAIRAIVCEN